MFASVIGAPMGPAAFLLCEGCAVLLGFLASLVFTRRGNHSGAFARSLVLLPPVVALVIMMVNGNIGAGLAVAGTFALVRFRSAPGSASEITGIFFTVALGLACGMGYLAFAGVFFVLVAAASLLMDVSRYGEPGSGSRHLKITVPEDLRYEEIFDDVFEKYTLSHELTRVRTTNMGTLYELTYTVRLRDTRATQDFIDAIRCRNGNLNVSCGSEPERDVM